MEATARLFSASPRLGGEKNRWHWPDAARAKGIESRRGREPDPLVYPSLTCPQCVYMEATARFFSAAPRLGGEKEYVGLAIGSSANSPFDKPSAFLPSRRPRNFPATSELTLDH